MGSTTGIRFYNVDDKRRSFRVDIVDVWNINIHVTNIRDEKGNQNILGKLF
jgi:hypothetical protein